MADIVDATLTIGAVDNDDKRLVTVGFKTNFTPLEISSGKKYKAQIKLFPHDGIGDQEPANLLPTPLYTFKFGSFLSQRDYVVITPHSDQISHSFSAKVGADRLNEDPGVTFIEVDINTTVSFPHPDEVYAVVTLSPQDEKKAKSPVVTLVA
jgi:hypothetical protein